MSGPPLRAVHQLVSSVDLGDAIGNHVRALRGLLRSVNPRVADRYRRGRFELDRLRTVTELALGVSEFNRRDLEAAGFPRTRALPILLDWEQYGALARRPSNSALATRRLPVLGLAPLRPWPEALRAYLGARGYLST